MSFINRECPCKLCGHIFLGENTCDCVCHIVTKGLLEINDNDPSKVIDSINDTIPKIDAMPKEIDKELFRLAMKAGPNADTTLLSDDEYKFLVSVSNTIRMVKKK